MLAETIMVKTIFLSLAMVLIFGCDQNRKPSGLGDGLGWTDDNTASEIAVMFIRAHKADWKVRNVIKGEDGWTFTFETPENESLILGSRIVFVRCDGGLVQFGWRG